MNRTNCMPGVIAAAAVNRGGRVNTADGPLADVPIAPPPVTFDDIVGPVCRYIGIPQWTVYDTGRHPRTVTARQLIVVLARRFTAMSTPEIATAMRRTNHSTVLTQINRWNRRMQNADEDKAEWVNTARGDVHPREAVEHLAGILRERQAA